MEYVEGSPLNGRCARDGEGIRRADRGCAGCGSSQGHRAPGFETREYFGTESGIKLLDFGLAKVVAADPEAENEVLQFETQAGVTLGTFPYMSPEQAAVSRCYDRLSSGRPVARSSHAFASGASRRAGKRGRNFRAVSARMRWPARRTLPSLIDATDSRAIAAKLEVKLDAGQKVVVNRTQNMEAYNLYLRGRHHWLKRTPVSYRQGRGILPAPILKRVADCGHVVHESIGGYLETLRGCGQSQPFDKGVRGFLIPATECEVQHRWLTNSVRDGFRKSLSARTA
jgi:hypothetical protein